MKKERYPVLCAWCQKEGTRNVLYFSTVENSHGMCEAHKNKMLTELRKTTQEG